MITTKFFSCFQLVKSKKNKKKDPFRILYLFKDKRTVSAIPCFSTAYHQLLYNLSFARANYRLLHLQKKNTNTINVLGSILKMYLRQGQATLSFKTKKF